ncbi:MAG: DUF2147 domain-containing protein [Pseudomonadota bacterium]
MSTTHRFSTLRPIAARLALISAAAFAAGILCLTVGQATAGSPHGLWQKAKTGERIRAYRCQGGLGLRVKRHKLRAVVGKIILCGAKANDAGQWTGRFTSPDDGKIYRVVVKVSGRKLLLSRCVLGGLVCKTEAWQRLR